MRFDVRVTRRLAREQRFQRAPCIILLVSAMCAVLANGWFFAAPLSSTTAAHEDGASPTEDLETGSWDRRWLAVAQWIERGADGVDALTERLAQHDEPGRALDESSLELVLHVLRAIGDPAAPAFAAGVAHGAIPIDRLEPSDPGAVEWALDRDWHERSQRPWGEPHRFRMLADGRSSRFAREARDPNLPMERRYRAAAALAVLRSDLDLAVPLLIDALSAEVTPRRAAATVLQQLGRLDGVALDEVFAGLVTDADADVRLQAVLYFTGTRPRPQSFEMLAPFALDDDPRIRSLVVHRLAQREPARARAMVIRALGDADPSVRVSAFMHLRSTNPREEIQAQIAKGLAESDASVVAMAAHAVWARPELAAAHVAALSDLTLHDDEVIAGHALASLLAIERESIPDEMFAWIESESPRRRAIAARLLEDRRRFHGEEWARFVADMLETPACRRYALGLVPTLGVDSKVCIPVLLELLKSQDDSTREAAVRALGVIEEFSRRIEHALVTVLDDSSSSVRRAAREALMKIAPGSPTVIDALVSRVARPFVGDVTAEIQLLTEAREMAVYSILDVVARAPFGDPQPLVTLVLPHVESFEPRLVAMLLRHGDHPGVRRARSFAAMTLAQARSLRERFLDAVEGELRIAMTAPNPFVRRAALRGAIANPAKALAVESALAGCRDRDRHLRAEALRALESIETDDSDRRPEILERARESAMDPDPGVREAARGLLVRYASPDDTENAATLDLLVSGYQERTDRERQKVVRASQLWIRETRRVGAPEIEAIRRMLSVDDASAISRVWQPYWRHREYSVLTPDLVAVANRAPERTALWALRVIRGMTVEFELLAPDLRRLIEERPGAIAIEARAILNGRDPLYDHRGLPPIPKLVEPPTPAERTAPFVEPMRLAGWLDHPDRDVRYFALDKLVESRTRLAFAILERRAAEAREELDGTLQGSPAPAPPSDALSYTEWIECLDRMNMRRGKYGLRINVSEDPSVSRGLSWSGERLAAIDHRVAIPALFEAARCGGSAIRERALKEITGRGVDPRPLLPLLRELVEAGVDGHTVIPMCRRLGPDGVSLLLALLENRNHWRAALEALEDVSRFAPEVFAAGLRDFLSRGAGSTVARRVLLGALPRFEGVERLEPFFVDGILGDSAALDRVDALLALDRLGSVGVLTQEQLLGLACGEDADLAIVASALFVDTYGTGRIDLSTLLDGFDLATGETLERVATTIANLGGEARDAVPFLAARARADSRYEAAAIRALAGIGESAIPALAGVLEQTHSFQARIAVANALRELGPAAVGALPALLEVMTSVEQTERARDAVIECARSLAPGARPLLDEIVENHGDRLRPAAALVLASIDEDVPTDAIVEALAIAPLLEPAVQELARSGRDAREAVPRLRREFAAAGGTSRARLIGETLVAIAPHDSGVLDTFVAAYRSPGYRIVRGDILRWLEQVGPLAVPGLLAVVDDVVLEPRWRIDALRVVCRVSPEYPPVFDRVEAMLVSKDATLARGAIPIACEAFPSSARLRLLLERLESGASDEQVRKSARGHLARWPKPRVDDSPR